MNRGGGKSVPVPAHLVEDWPVWRIVSRQMATLHEIESFWSLGDVLDANEVLDLMDEAARPEK